MKKSKTKSGSPVFPSLEEVEMIIGYEFKNKELLKEAFTAKSYKVENNCQSYKRLEYLGDSFLTHIIAREHYFKYPELQSGKLTLLRSANVDTEALARVAVKHGLHRFIRHQDPQLEGRVQKFKETLKDYPLHAFGLIYTPKILADIVESLIGAVYVDTNLSIDVTWELGKNLLHPLTTLEKLEQNPMAKLIEMCQKMRIKYVVYRKMWDETGVIEIHVGNKVIGKGQDKGKKATAEFKAAADAYNNLVK